MPRTRNKTLSPPWIGKQTASARTLAFKAGRVSYYRVDLKKEQWAREIADKWDWEQDTLFVAVGQRHKLPELQARVATKNQAYLVVDARYQQIPPQKQTKTQSGMVVLRRVDAL